VTACVPQSLLCGGAALHNACGRRHLPPANQRSATVFIKSLNLDPRATDHWRCPSDSSSRRSSSSRSSSESGFDDLNRFTFSGSYYHVYVKLASCPPPAGIGTLCQSVSLFIDVISNAQPFKLTAFVRDNPGRPVPEETLTHSHPT